jgi:RNA polymerase sigma-70 factor (ECF subfamily)
VAWLIGTARHKLVDHWRRRERELRTLRLVEGAQVDDPWDVRMDALTLRYVDDLPVPQVAELLQRTVHATEALLVRARTAFRRDYVSTPRSPLNCASACAVPCCSRIPHPCHLPEVPPCPR